MYSDLYPFGYNYPNRGGFGLPQGLQMFPRIIGVIIGFAIIIGLANYLFKAFGMYGMAKKLNVKYPWLAFIPIASNYLQGDMAGEIKIGTKTMKSPGLWMLLAPIIIKFIILVFYMILVFTVAFSYAINNFGGSLNPNMLPHPITAFPVFFIIISFILATLLRVLVGLIRYTIHKKYVDESLSVIHMIFGLFIPLYQAIYFFILRNRYPKGMPNPYDSWITGQDAVAFAKPAPVQDLSQRPSQNQDFTQTPESQDNNETPQNPEQGSSQE